MTLNCNCRKTHMRKRLLLLLLHGYLRKICTHTRKRSSSSCTLCDTLYYYSRVHIAFNTHNPQCTGYHSVRANFRFPCDFSFFSYLCVCVCCFLQQDWQIPSALAGTDDRACSPVRAQAALREMEYNRAQWEVLGIADEDPVGLLVGKLRLHTRKRRRNEVSV